MPIDEVHSGAGSTPHADIDAVVGHVVRVPDLDVLARARTSIKNGSHAPHARRAIGPGD